MGRLDGKAALVTGGSRGIGRGIVERFAAEGARVYATGRSPLAEPFRARGVVFAQGDVAREADVARIVEDALAKLGRIDVLVANAGIMKEKPIAETTEAEWDEQIGINLKGTFLCAKHVIPRMQAQGGGSIVTMGSISGFFADPAGTAYCASKGGVHMLTRGIAVDYGKDNIRCNSICPGWIATDMTAPALPDTPEGALVRRKVLASHPLGRIGEPEDIAAMAVFLASDEARWITGQFFTVDGGLTARSHSDGSPPVR